MQPWQTLKTASLAGKPLTLRRRGEEYLIQIDGVVLMPSRRHGSENALADPLKNLSTKKPRVLIGGLGCGHTVRAALDRLPAGAELVVAEVSPDIVAWNRDEIAHVAQRPLDDPRTQVFLGDVSTAIRQGGWDGILLDVDNGPTALSLPSNEKLYSVQGIAALKNALQARGVLAVWSAGPDAGFVSRLERAGFKVSTQLVLSHVLFIAVR